MPHGVQDVRAAYCWSGDAIRSRSVDGVVMLDEEQVWLTEAPVSVCPESGWFRPSTVRHCT